MYGVTKTCQYETQNGEVFEDEDSANRAQFIYSMKALFRSENIHLDDHVYEYMADDNLSIYLRTKTYYEGKVFSREEEEK